MINGFSDGVAKGAAENADPESGLGMQIQQGLQHVGTFAYNQALGMPAPPPPGIAAMLKSGMGDKWG